jgi:hypothetical protein
MRRPVTPEDAARHVMNGELSDEFRDRLLEKESFCFQFLGLDNNGLAVYYASDDGTLIRYLPGDDSLEREETSHLGHELDSDSARVDPFATAFTYLTVRGENWMWVHPRFRWLAENAVELQELREQVV